MATKNTKRAKYGHDQPEAFLNAELFRLENKWGQHESDMKWNRFSKCAKRINTATTEEKQYFKASGYSFLSLGIAAAGGSCNAKTKRGAKMEQSLIECAQALVENSIPFEDKYNKKTVLLWAASQGFSRLLKYILGVPGACHGEDPEVWVNEALESAAENKHLECVQVLLQSFPSEIECQLKQGVDESYILYSAIDNRDAAISALLIQHGAMLTDNDFSLSKRKRKSDDPLQDVLRSLYPHASHARLLGWDKKWHWSFPLADRHVLNWLHAVVSSQRYQGSLPPVEVWLHVFSFIGRDWFQ